jgi:hypothetical protein
VGHSLVPRWRISALWVHATHARVELVRDDGRKLVLGVAQRSFALPAPPPVDFPDLTLWYEGSGETPEGYALLASSLARLLREAAGRAPLARALAEWRTDALSREGRDE